MDSSQFSDVQPHFEAMQPVDTNGATCDAFRVKLFGKLHFLKRLKAEYANDIRYQEAFRKEFETGYRLEHPHLVRYISFSDDGILMEYVDGETLSHRLAANPDYFNSRKNTDKLLRQLLDAVGYLHSHQVLHLDLKPDNIMLTRIGSDVKLIDLGCCLTDTFADTPGRTPQFAAPEQLHGDQVDERTDIYAIGRIMEQLPCHHIYNKVIAHCTAPDKAYRYQSVAALEQAIANQRLSTFHRMMLMLFTLTSIVLTFFLLNYQPAPVPKALQPVETDTAVIAETVALVEDTLEAPRPVVTKKAAVVPPPKQDSKKRMSTELSFLIDQAYQETIFYLCDSVFPSPTVGEQWKKASTDFHQRVIQIGDQLTAKYPDLPESSIRQEAENQFQNLVAFVFSKMRENGAKTEKK